MADENSGFMDLSQLGGLLTAVTEGANTRIQNEQRVLDVTAEEASRLQSATLAHQNLVMNAAEKQKRITAHAEQEAQWGNEGILGMLSQLGASTLDPQNYTSQGRAAQMDVVNQTLQTGNLVLDSQARVGEARVKKSAADAAVNIYSAESAMVRLRAQTEAVQLAAAGIGASENLRLLGIDKMDRDTVTSALGSPAMAATGKTKINGFEYSKVELEEKKKNIEVRENLAVMSPQITDPAYGVKLAAFHRLLAQEMSTIELQDLANRGGDMGGGIKMDPDVIDSELVRKKQREATKVADSLAVAGATQQFPIVLKNTYDLIKHFDTTGTIQPNTPLSASLLKFRSAAASVDSAAAMADPSGVGQVTAMAALDAARAEFDSAVDAEAKRRSGGDEMLTSIIRSQIYGEPVNPALMTEFVTTRYSAGLPFGQSMPVADATELKAVIDTELRGLAQQQNAVGIDSTGIQYNAKEMKAMAATAGIQKFVAGRAGEVVKSAASYAMGRSDNPLVMAGVTPTMYTAIGMQASMKADIDTGTQNGIAPDKIEATFAAIRAGQPEIVGLTRAQAADLGAQSNQAAVMIEMDLLESQQSGLGVAYAEWNVANGMSVAMERSKIKLVGAQGIADPLSGLYAEAVAEQASVVSAVWSNAVNTASGRTDRVLQESYMRAKDPGLMFHAVLSTMDTLTQTEKTNLYDKVLLPVLNKAKEQGLDGDQASQLIHLALENGIPNDPALSVAAQKALRAMPGAMGTYNTLLGLMTDPANIKRAAQGGLFADMQQGLEGQTPTLYDKTAAQLMFSSQGKPQGFLATIASGGTNGVSMDPRAVIESPGGLQAILDEMHNQGWMPKTE